MAAFTNQGQALIAQLMSEGKALKIDQVIFANIPDLDIEGDIDRDSVKPNEELIQFEAPIYRASYVSDSAVVYSAFLDSTIGGFEFNWFGLYCSEHETLVALEYTQPQKKVKTSGGTYGNNLTKNFVFEFNGAQALTGIEIPAESWQLNFADQVNELYARTEQATESKLGILAIATLDEIKAGDSAIKAITPKALKPVLDQIRTDLVNFQNRKDNPHQVSKHQVGLGQVNNYPATSNLAEDSTQKVVTAAITNHLNVHKADWGHQHQPIEVGLSNLFNYPIVHDAANGGEHQYASGLAVKYAYEAGVRGINLANAAQQTANTAQQTADTAKHNAAMTQQHLDHQMQNWALKSRVLYSHVRDDRCEGSNWEIYLKLDQVQHTKILIICIADSEFYTPGQPAPPYAESFVIPRRPLSEIPAQTIFSMHSANKGYLRIHVTLTPDKHLRIQSCGGDWTNLVGVEEFY